MIRKKGDIIRSVETARNRFPVGDDQNMAVLKDAKTGSPVMVYTPEGEPSLWLVPLVYRELACGFAEVTLSGSVTRIGTFGAGSKDSSGWIDPEFFKKPPPGLLHEIRSTYPDTAISKALFSFDSNSIRWGWILKIRKKDNTATILFITPGGWYEQQPKQDMNSPIEF